jgi:hypothetical protein
VECLSIFGAELDLARTLTASFSDLTASGRALTIEIRISVRSLLLLTGGLPS